MKAYIAVTVRAGVDFAVRSRFEGLREDFPAIKDVDVVYGPYDLIVTLEADELRTFYEGHAAITGEAECQSTATFIVAEPELILRAREKVADYVRRKMAEIESPQPSEGSE